MVEGFRVKLMVEGRLDEASSYGFGGQCTRVEPEMTQLQVSPLGRNMPIRQSAARRGPLHRGRPSTL